MVWNTFDRTSRAYPQHDFLYVPASAQAPAGHQSTYQQVRDAVEPLAAGLAAAGFEPAEALRAFCAGPWFISKCPAMSGFRLACRKRLRKSSPGASSNEWLPGVCPRVKLLTCVRSSAGTLEVEEGLRS